MEHGYREIYISSDRDLKPTLPVSSAPVRNDDFSGTTGIQYKMGPPVYKSGVYVERDNTRPPRPNTSFVRTTTYNVADRNQLSYRIHHEQYSPGSNSESPPPPPYPSPRHSPVQGHGYYELNRGPQSGMIVYHSETASLPKEGAAIYQNLPGPRSPSPYQERKDIETLVPTYTASYPQNERFPSGAPSKIVYSTHLPPQGQGQVSSKPTSEGGTVQTQSMLRTNQPYKSPANTASKSPIYKSPLRSDASSASPRPYQLKPTMDSYNSKPSASLKSAGSGKEAEVDALTSLLIQNMEVSGDPDFFGQCSLCGRAVFGYDNACQAMDSIYHVQCFVCADCGMCVKCGRAIMGDNSGCSALDQIFHIECFTCITCGMCLKGHQFFAMEGKPYCEPCYMNTLEKCSVCSKPITDRILRATGKPYHPDCFTCVVCGKSLDGVQFTVDATNQIHCIEDFHKKFAPRCCVCNEPIKPESEEEETVRIVAMDRSFHVKCYKCEDCGLQLSSEADGRGCYPLDDHILCKQCNARRIQAMTTRMMTEL